MFHLFIYLFLAHCRQYYCLSADRSFLSLAFLNTSAVAHHALIYVSLDRLDIVRAAIFVNSNF